MNISLEAVPRDRESFRAALKAAAAFQAVSEINVPDLPRFGIRAWEACEIIAAETRGSGSAKRFSATPHIRARDFDPAKPFPHTETFARLGIKRALVIAGDPPENPAAPAETPAAPPAETPAFIGKLKKEMPALEIYAAFDPYRTNIRYELDYLKEKEDAGARGFISQPFFDLRLLEIYAEYLEGKNVYWGISPVLSAFSRNYWESRNRAIFPRSFRPDLYWNVDFGRRVLDFCRQRNFNLCLMPIKVDLKAYLTGLFC